MAHTAQFSKNYTLEVDTGHDGVHIRIKGPIPAHWRSPEGFSLQDAEQHAFLWSTRHFLEHLISEEHVAVEHITWESV
jgi:hypothetical protein